MAALRNAPIHIISCLRAKEKHEINEKKQVVKLGQGSQMRDGFEYEFDVVFNMDTDNNAIVTKTRCPALAGSVIRKPDHEVAEVLTNWLHGVKREPMTVDQAKEVKTGKGARLVDLTKDQLSQLKSHHMATPEQREAATILLEAQGA